MRFLRTLALCLSAMATALPCPLLAKPQAGPKTASRHPMQYYLSLPEGWNPQRSWPVVVVIPDAGRDFLGNLDAFVKARGRRPFILVAPCVVTSGGSSYRSSPTYRYGIAGWKEVERAGDFEFDSAGIAAVIEDVRATYKGQSKYFLTGWEAGGHTVWAMTFRHPEALAGVVPVSTNWRGRWVEDATFSKAPERGCLPIQVYFCGQLRWPENVARAACLQQTREAILAAKEHGFAPIPLEVVENRPHGPLAEDVLAWVEARLASK